MLAGLAGTSALSGALATPALAGLSRPDIIIGWTPWSDAEAVTKLAATVLRSRMGADVELTLADIHAQFRTVASGEIDAMLMSWEPGLHARYLARHGDDIEDLGILYRGTIGLGVPEWVDPDFVSSIPDLAKPDVVDAMQGVITGIDPGAGVMEKTREAMKLYGLDYELLEGTGPRMVREIALAQRRKSGIVTTAWRPHAKFPLYGMRYLSDPEGVFDQTSEIHARAHPDLRRRSPEIVRFLERFSLSIDEIETIMVTARQLGMDGAVQDWIAANPGRVDSWIG